RVERSLTGTRHPRHGPGCDALFACGVCCFAICRTLCSRSICPCPVRDAHAEGRYFARVLKLERSGRGLPHWASPPDCCSRPLGGTPRGAMRNSIAVMNTKGGVGKSTLVLAMAETLSVKFAKTVLVIDGDAQASVSLMLLSAGNLHRLQLDGLTL